MTLPPPKLDDRDYRSLVEEARARIPTYTGDWTNFNESDPGMTLVQLHAWLTETLLWRMNRLPDLAYVNFLNLIGTQPAPARAATAELTFTLAKLDKAQDPLTVLIPKNVTVGVDDPDLASPISFETDSSLRAINAAVAAITVPGAVAGDRALVGSYHEDSAELLLTQPFRPFGDATAAAEMRVGLLLRPYRDDKQNYFLDRFPEGELDVTVFVPEVYDTDADGEEIEGPFGMTCLFPWQVTEGGADLVWEVYDGTDPATDMDTSSAWKELTLRGDDTAGLARSGHLYLDMPAGLSAVPFTALSREHWKDLGLSKPPGENIELAEDIENEVFIPADLAPDIWKDQLGLPDPDLADPIALAGAIKALPDELDFAAVESDAWTDLGYSAPPVTYGLIWLRARLTTARDRAPEISAIRLNTVRATAATTRTNETLGTSAGRPNQSFKTKRAPILIDPATDTPDITIDLVDASGTRSETWERGEDFFGAGRDTNRYLLDPETGTITFGDGVNGRIPVAGTRIIASGYRVGGGAAGNVAAGTITSLKTALPRVEKVTNHRDASGGSDAETLDQAKLRAPQQLRTRDRAVSADDFADLALRTPGVDLKSAFALPLVALDHATDPPTHLPNSAGAVTVVVLPNNADPKPQPSEDQLRLICAYLNERRLITTELYVTGPRYLDINTLEAEILVRPDEDLKAVQDRCLAALAQYFHPLDGGYPDETTGKGPGWPIGGDIYTGNVFDRLLAQEGVLRVPSLSIGTADDPADACLDRLTVPEGTLVHLPGTVAKLTVRYPRGD
ncbi:hypothetical protein RGUI_3680 [Rhodovulum sp. P5]|uniref:putative baseplate assembly protein n=1 Tax=Rhodovulum sp. P5 TaxID=1564506 RepID=UPI0009C282C7|nr:putative baseplate assembly protein [Rhodovulum sp. P5]ARE41821.1 hypothetical protein RGUI_3680 [Rhodovulum sp. P5]